MDARKGDEQATAKAQQQAQAAETATPLPWRRGESLSGALCACHQPAGTGLPGIFRRSMAQGDHRRTIGPSIWTSSLHGKSGTAMQPFGKQLTAQELAAVITWRAQCLG